MTDLESLIAEVQQEHRERMTEIGRARATRGATGSVGFIFCCETCEGTFSRAKRGYRFCSPKCSNAARLRFSRETLRRLATSGERLKVMAKQLSVQERSVRTALRRSDLYRTWQQARYLKCK